MISIPICGEQTGNELKLQPLNPTKQWSCWRAWGGLTPIQGSQEVDLDLPRDLVLKMLSRLNLLSDLPFQGSQEVDMPQPAWGFDLQKVDMPQPA